MNKFVSKIKLETVLLVVFFASVALFMVKKCQSDRANYVKTNSTAGTTFDEGRPVRTDTVMPELGAPKPQEYSAPPVLPTSTSVTSEGGVPKLAKPVLDGIEGDEGTETTNVTVETSAPNQAQPTGKVPKIRVEKDVESPTVAAPVRTVVQEKSILYITIDRLKVRKEPTLQSPVVTRLKLHEKVYFLGERTKHKDEINLGYKTVSEPWVKVETNSGKVGWVYGAGVDIMKTVQDGVMK